MGAIGLIVGMICGVLIGIGIVCRMVVKSNYIGNSKGSSDDFSSFGYGTKVTAYDNYKRMLVPFDQLDINDFK